MEFQTNNIINLRFIKKSIKLDGFYSNIFLLFYNIFCIFANIFLLLFNIFFQAISIEIWRSLRRKLKVKLKNQENEVKIEGNLYYIDYIL